MLWKSWTVRWRHWALRSRPILGNQAVEAQCKVINANYVDNVIVKTYTALCDQAEILYKNIKNIKNIKK